MLLSFSSKCIVFTEIMNTFFSLLDGTSTSASKSTNSSQRSLQQHSNYQIPASALYETTEDQNASVTSAQAASAGRISNFTYHFLLLYYDDRFLFVSL